MKHERRCHDCETEFTAEDNVLPACECPKCGSADTRATYTIGTTEPTAHELKRMLLEVLGYACTVEQENTTEWLDGFCDLANDAAQLCGFEIGRYERGDRPAIFWCDSSEDDRE